MKVKVTSDHIGSGTQRDDTCCPIALAMIEMGFSDVEVGTSTVKFVCPDTGKVYEVPHSAKSAHFVAKFDGDDDYASEPAEPFEFDLELALNMHVGPEVKPNE